jgi:predicted enzyme related to lactoylglutathione lyase
MTVNCIQLRRWLFAACLAVTATAGRAAPTAPQFPPLTSNDHSPRLPGKFVWADLVTDDVAAERAFYGRLFGWTFRELGNYTVAQNDERPLAGIIQQAKPKGRPAQPRWFAYLSVGSVGKAQRAVTKGGGTVLAPSQNLPARGEQALFKDPEGAIFGVIKSSAGDPQDFMADPGDWIWIQLLSRDAKKASGFYHDVGGYDVQENSNANRLSDYVLTSDGFARATVRTIPSANTSVQPAWLPFVRVKNVSDSVAQAKQLGGKALIEPKPELLNGKVAVIADPTGAAIGIMEWPEGAAKGGR